MIKKLGLFSILLFTLLLAACGVRDEQTNSSIISQENSKIEQSENLDQSMPITSQQQIDESVVVESVADESATVSEEVDDNHMKLKIGDTIFTATLANNSSAEALKKMLANGPITIDMRDYANMEKVGSLGESLPRNDEQITTEPGDIILYQGNALVIYYAPNSWSFTRLGKIDNVTQEQLKAALGTGDVKVTLSLN